MDMIGPSGILQRPLCVLNKAYLNWFFLIKSKIDVLILSDHIFLFRKLFVTFFHPLKLIFFCNCNFFVRFFFKQFFLIGIHSKQG